MGPSRTVHTLPNGTCARNPGFRARMSTRRLVNKCDAYKPPPNVANPLSKLTWALSTLRRS
eukprot:4120309-Pyramimonas_sp.AAC.1